MSTSPEGLSLRDHCNVDVKDFFKSKNRSRAIRELSAMYLAGVGFARTLVEVESPHRQLSEIALTDEMSAALSNSGITSVAELLVKSPHDLQRTHGIGQVGLPKLIMGLAEAGYFLGAPTREIEESLQLEVLCSFEQALEWLGRDSSLFVLTMEEMFWSGRSFEVGRLEVGAEVPVSMMRFKKRTHNCLASRNLVTVGELVRESPHRLMMIPNFGFNSLVDVISGLSDVGTFLGDSRLGQHTNEDSQEAFERFRENARRSQVSKVTELLSTGANLSIIAAESGVTIEDVRAIATDLYGSSSLTVIRAENLRRKRGQPEGPDPRQERLERIMRLRIQGQSYRQIGEQFGVTAEAIRRVVARNKRMFDEMRTQFSEELDETVRAQVEAGRPIHEIAESTGITQVSVLERLTDEKLGLMRNDFIQFLVDHRGIDRETLLKKRGISLAAARKLADTAIDRLSCSRLVSGSSEKVFTDEEILASLREAATYAFPLTAKAYGDLIYVGEIVGPSVPTIYNRFESWTKACEKAGVEPGGALRVYERMWSQSDLQSYVCEYLADPSSKGTFADLEKWLAADESRPSPALIRGRLGGWIKVKNEALVSEYMSSLLEGQRR